MKSETGNEIAEEKVDLLGLEEKIDKVEEEITNTQLGIPFESYDVNPERV